MHALLLFLLGLALSFSMPALAGDQKPPALSPFSIREAAEVRTGSSPDNSYALFTDLLDSAKKEIRLAAYMLRSPGISSSLANAAQRGVKVTLLLDGWTVGRPSAEKIDKHELFMARKVVNAGGKVFYLRSGTGTREDRRFRFIHAKYAVVDDTLFLSSENFADNGFSPTASLGSRGWVISVRNRALASNFSRLFDRDLAPFGAYDDIVAYGRHPDYTLKDPEYSPSSGEKNGRYLPNRGITVKETMGMERVLSPDDALAGNRAIIGAIRKAKETLEIENLSFAPHWGSNSDTPASNPNPVAEAVLDAARRGLRVRILLNPPYFFNKPKNDGPEEEESYTAGLWQELASSWEELTFLNLPFSVASPTGTSGTAPSTKDNNALLEYFRDTAQRERLDLQAHFFYVNEDSLRILHNKGMIVDGRKTLVSSINWTENSMKNNRETAVIVDSAAVASYYRKLFEVDWKYFRNQN